MVANSNIKTYYLSFIHESKVNKRKAEQILKDVINKEKELKDFLIDNKNIIKSRFKLNLDNYIVWNEEQKTINNNLLVACLKKSSTETADNKNILYKVCAYCNTINRKYKLRKIIAINKKKSELKFGEYRKYVNRFYSQVHKVILEGASYKFNNGIGSFIINYWKTDNSNRKPTIDYNATRLNKQKLIEAGIKVYNDCEAAWYKARHIPYDGVPYVVYKTENYYYEFVFIHSRIVVSGKYQFEHTEYLHAKLRGNTVASLAKKYCHTIDDIYKMPMDIKFKLNVLLYKDPTKYLNFIRNAEQRKYKYRTHNSED